MILYTSADSVLQLAAHDDVVPEPELLRGVRGGARGDARRARRRPRHRAAVHGRRPATSPAPAAGATSRSSRRGRSYLVELHDAGVPVHAVGKIRDLFAGVGIDRKHTATTNEEGLAATTALLRDLDGGLIFTNLVETDQVYGHRHDVSGFARALERIDAAVGGGSTRSWAPTTCSSSPPTTASTRGRRTPTTRASTRRCWPCSPATAAAATTARSPTSARARSTGSPAATRPRSRGRASSARERHRAQTAARARGRRVASAAVAAGTGSRWETRGESHATSPAGRRAARADARGRRQAVRGAVGRRGARGGLGLRRARGRAAGGRRRPDDAHPGPDRRHPDPHLHARGQRAARRHRLLPRQWLGHREHRHLRRRRAVAGELDGLRGRVGQLPEGPRAQVPGAARRLLGGDRVGVRERRRPRDRPRAGSRSRATARAATSPPPSA